MPVLSLPLLAALIWVALLVTVVLRFFGSRRLDEYAAPAPADSPPVSVVIPARNEARNIEACLRSVLASEYPQLEVIVVDDHSSDGTGALALAVAEEDAVRRRAAGVPAAEASRVRVVQAPDLPAGWFGKQWACHTGAQAARGALLCFTDADTRHGPDLLGRSISAMRVRGADLFSVAGDQEAQSFWEKVLQPYVFALLLSRYGSLEAMSRSTKPVDKIANGQFILMARTTYDAIGGHAAVRDHVAEDLRLAQLVTARGMSAHTVLGRDQMRTRMYASLAEIRRGWGKNVYAGGRDTIPLGPVTRRIFPWIFPVPALLPVFPLLCLVLGGLGVWGPWAWQFGVVAGPATLAYYLGVYGYARVGAWWGLTYPLAAVVFSAICAEAAWRGSRVEWKGRGYVSRSAA